MTKRKEDHCGLVMRTVEDRDFLSTDRRCYFEVDCLMKCHACGEGMPMPLGDLNWVTKVMKAFSDSHKHCDLLEPKKGA